VAIQRTVAAHVPFILHSAYELISVCRLADHGTGTAQPLFSTHLEHLPFENEALLCGRDAGLLLNLRYDSRGA